MLKPGGYGHGPFRAGLRRAHGSPAKPPVTAPICDQGLSHCQAVRVQSNAGSADFMGPNRTDECSMRRERAIIFYTLPALRTRPVESANCQDLTPTECASANEKSRFFCGLRLIEINQRSISCVTVAVRRRRQLQVMPWIGARRVVGGRAGDALLRKVFYPNRPEATGCVTDESCRARTVPARPGHPRQESGCNCDSRDTLSKEEVER